METIVDDSEPFLVHYPTKVICDSISTMTLPRKKGGQVLPWCLRVLMEGMMCRGCNNMIVRHLLEASSKHDWMD